MRYAVLLCAAALAACGEPTTPVELAAAPVAFERIVAGERDLWRVRLDGTDLLKLTADTGEDRWPSVAAGSIYYVYFHNVPAPIFAIPTTGGSAVQITTVSAAYDEAAISADGNSFTFTRSGKVFVSDRSGANAHRLTTSGTVTVEAAPMWSPDGKSIAFVSSGNAASADIYVATLTTGAAKAVVSTSDAEVQPCWSPDGKQIAFARGTTTGTHLFTIDLATAKEKQLTSASGTQSLPSWLPDGRIVFAVGSASARTLYWLDPRVKGTPSHQVPGAIDVAGKITAIPQ